MRRLLKQIAMQILCGLAVVVFFCPLRAITQTAEPAQAKGEASTGQDANRVVLERGFERGFEPR